MQIDLICEVSSSLDPVLSEVRILENGSPRITDVIISGSNSVHEDYSFADAFSQGIHQFRTVPVGGANTVEIVFSEWVDVEAADLALFGGYTGAMYTPIARPSGFNFNAETLTAKWVFGVFPADIMMIGLNYQSFIYDMAGNKLDGNCADTLGLAYSSPTSFPSGDGDNDSVRDDMFFFSFVILPGDHDLDNDGDGAGFLWWQRNYAPNAIDRTFEDGDFDGNGNVDSADLALWQGELWPGLHLPVVPL